VNGAYQSAWLLSRSCSSWLEELNAYPGSPVAATLRQFTRARQSPAGSHFVIEAGVGALFSREAIGDQLPGSRSSGQFTTTIRFARGWQGPYATS
jgi:hypothetical protein